MNKHFFLLLMLLWVSGSVWVSCSDDAAGVTDPEIHFTVSEKALQFEATGGRCELLVESSVEWTLSADETAHWCTLSAQTGTGQQTVVVTVQPLEGEQDRTCRLMFRYQGQCTEVKVVQHATLQSAYVEMHWGEKSTIASYQEQTGQLVVDVTPGEAPSLHRGSVLVLPEAYGHQIVVVEKVVSAGRQMKLSTVPGDMSSLFQKVRFVLTTDTHQAASVRGDASVRVVTPSEIWVDRGTGRRKVYDGRRTRAQDLWGFQFAETVEEVSLLTGEGLHVVADALKMNFGGHLTLTCDFGLFKLNAFDCQLRGEWQSSMSASWILQQAQEHNWHAGVIQQPCTHSYLFHVSGIPVWVGVRFGAEMGGAFHFDRPGGARIDNQTTQATVDLCLSYKGGEADFSRQIDYSMVSGVPMGAPDHTLRTYLAPRVDVQMYGSASSQFTVSPYWSSRTAYSEDLDSPRSGWEAEIKGGLESTMKFTKAFAEKDTTWHESDCYSLPEKKLAKVPGRISLCPSDAYADASVGVPVVVTFQPEQYYHCLDTFGLYFSPIVHLSSTRHPHICTTQSSIVMHTWVPEHPRDTLFADVYDAHSQLVSRAYFAPQLQQDVVREFLTHLYRETNGDTWKNNTHWLSDKPVDQWYGVTVEGNTYTVNLNGNGLQGDLRRFSKSLPSRLKWDITLNDNQLQSVDFSGCESLVGFSCKGNPLTQLRVDGCSRLVSLDCSNNRLTELDLSGCGLLYMVYCSENQLAKLCLDRCAALKMVHCDYNQLTKLDLSGCRALASLDCSNNRLTELNLGRCDVASLNCSSNRLTELDVSSLKSVFYLDCSDNRVVAPIPPNLDRCSLFIHDSRYEYIHFPIELPSPEWTQLEGGGYYKQNEVGWWYPGEPYSGKHERVSKDSL